MRGTRLSARTRRSSMQVAGADANRRDSLEGGFEDGILVACTAVISWWKFLDHQRWPRTRMTSRQQKRCVGEPGRPVAKSRPKSEYGPVIACEHLESYSDVEMLAAPVRRVRLRCLHCPPRPISGL